MIVSYKLHMKMSIFIFDAILATQSQRLRDSLYDMGWFSGDSALKRAYEWYNVDYKHAASAADLSASHMAPKAFEKGSTEEFVTSNEGIQKLIAEIAREIDQDVKGNNCGTSGKLKCSSPVTRILSDYSKQGNPIVIYQNTSSGKPSNVSVSAKYVLITVSLGVLKRGQIEFDPPLSAEKQNAIQKFGMGNLAKIFAQFDDSFWNLKPLFSGRKKPVQNVITASYNSSYFNAFVNLAAYNSSWTTLVLSATGVQSSVIETRSDSENKADVMTQLDDMFENYAGGVKFTVLVAKWETDRHFYGSRSYWPAGFKEVDHEYLRSTERGRIFFAGEATSKDFFGFLQGAICTGLDQADAIIKLLPYDQNGADSLFLDNLRNGCNSKHVSWWHVWWHSVLVALGLLVVSAAFTGTTYHGIKRCRRQNPINPIERRQNPINPIERQQNPINPINPIERQQNPINPIDISDNVARANNQACN